jgi:hypothetical protein
MDKEQLVDELIAIEEMVTKSLQPREKYDKELRKNVYLTKTINFLQRHLNDYLVLAGMILGASSSAI